VIGVRFLVPAYQDSNCSSEKLAALPDFTTFIVRLNINLIDEAILKSSNEKRWIDVHFADYSRECGV
jgi:hypothetical protein